MLSNEIICIEIFHNYISARRAEASYIKNTAAFAILKLILNHPSKAPKLQNFNVQISRVLPRLSRSQLVCYSLSHLKEAILVAGLT